MANAEKAIPSERVKLLELEEAGTTPPTRSLTGLIYVSGGALYYRGASTITEIAAA